MLNFDKYGNLTPYDIIETDWEQFVQTFIAGFEDKTQRARLLSKYETYLNELKVSFNVPFYQWVNGSFVTMKQQPGDIDLVTFLPYDLIVKKAIFVEKLRKSSKQLFGVDGFFAPVANWNHRFYESTLKEAERWKNLFNTSRDGHPKGIIKLNFKP